MNKPSYRYRDSAPSVSRRSVHKGKSDGYNLIMTEARTTGDWYDPYGAAMGWLFALAEVMYVSYGEMMPEFTPSIVMVEGDRSSVEGYEAESLFEFIDAGLIDDDDIREAYATLSRYDDWVRVAGRNY